MLITIVIVLRNLVMSLPSFFTTPWVWIGLMPRLLGVPIVAATNTNADTIVVFIHGRNADASQVAALHVSLARHSHLSLTAVSLGSGSNSIAFDTEQVINHLTSIYGVINKRRFILVGISKGGLTAMSVAHQLKSVNTNNITVITLASPLRGTFVGQFALCKTTRAELSPNSDVTTKLSIQAARMVQDGKLQVYHAHAKNDHLIHPMEAATYDFVDAKNVYRAEREWLYHGIIQYDPGVIAWLGHVIDDVVAPSK